MEDFQVAPFHIYLSKLNSLTRTLVYFLNVCMYVSSNLNMYSILNGPFHR